MLISEPHIWKLINILLNIWVKEDFKKEIKNYFELDKNEGILKICEMLLKQYLKGIL